MKQLTIYCSKDEESRVISALDHAGVDSFLRVGDATGNRFLDPGQVPRTMTWEALMIAVAGVTEAQVKTVVDELGDYTRSCEYDACIRITVSPIDDVH